MTPDDRALAKRQRKRQAELFRLFGGELLQAAATTTSDGGSVVVTVIRHPGGHVVTKHEITRPDGTKETVVS